MGGTIPKQFLLLSQKPILQHTLERFQSFDRIQAICVVVPADFRADYETKIRQDWGIAKIHAVLAGGAQRHLSVWKGIEAVPKESHIIMIHDGVRPFVSERMVHQSIDAALQHGAAVVGIPPKDTVKQVNAQRIHHTLKRDTLFLAQTPQTFQTQVIRRANELAFAQHSFSTDDAALVEQMGHLVATVQGDWKNIKITSPEDLIIANAIWESDNL